ncbi:uncharacterized protein LOC129793807 [Lutzomyia longipalpis]|uniref:uncharacterized protein LOC129793807 n=1 Tax=Lutzomyia longipalpis TaxID=7200 RepID=UPI002484351D|nr:uncharacterized protein LOC129793807 [Lutzomyia longipalpis]
MRMKFFLLLWLVVNVQGFRIAEDVFSDLFPFDVDYEDWLEDDAVRQKRDPLSIVLTVENDKCGKDDPTYLSLPEGKLESPKKGSELFVKACPCKSKSSASKKSPTSMRKPPKPPAQPPKQPPVVEGPPVMPPVIEKPPVHSYIPVDPPKLPTEHEEPSKVEPPKEPEPPKTVPENPFEYLKKDPEYSPELSGRFFAGDSMEYLSSSKKITSMESEELLNGKYAGASSIWDREIKQSPMATYASMKWDTNPFAPPPQPAQPTSPHYFVDYVSSQHHKDLPYEVQYKQPPPDVMKLIDKLYSTPEHTWTKTDHNFGDKELEIIHRINTEYDFRHSQSEYERQERTREAVLDYIKSKYYLKSPTKQSKKRIFVVHSNF